ncbi:MAG: molecular chaperone DnaJ [Bacilli bacterium]|nr:molecular chaperone DnaJ [Bacilli bacterium]
MSTKRDYYEVLGVNKDASKDVIKSAYRKLVKQYHPDINKAPNAEEKFKEIQEAYDVLSDDSKRANYDQYGHNFSGYKGFNGEFSSGNFSNFSNFEDFDDILSSFFGGGRKRKRRTSSRGEDVIKQVKISFMEAVLGTNISMNVTYNEKCSVCGGKGGKTQICSNCNGSGVVNRYKQTFFGNTQVQETCSKCSGSGEIIVDRCSFCKGKGFNKTASKIDVKVPAGINSGQQIRLSGKGGSGINGGENGDLYLEFFVQPHEFFEREGNDIHVEIQMSSIDIILGDKVKVPTIYGDIFLTIPQSTQPTEIFRLRQRGVKDVRRPNIIGDQYVHLKITTPTKLSNKQIELLKEFKEEENNKIGNNNYFNRFKNFFN